MPLIQRLNHCSGLSFVHTKPLFYFSSFFSLHLWSSLPVLHSTIDTHFNVFVICLWIPVYWLLLCVPKYLIYVYTKVVLCCSSLFLPAVGNFYACLLISLVVDGCFCFWFTAVRSVAMSILVTGLSLNLCIIFFCGLFLELDFLGQENAYTVSPSTARLLFRKLASFYILTSNTWGCLFPYMPTNFWYYLSF